MAPIRYTETRHKVLASIAAGTYRPGGLYVGAGKGQAVEYLRRHRLIHTTFELGRLVPIGLTQSGEDQLAGWNAENGTPGVVALGPALTHGSHEAAHPSNGFELREYGTHDNLRCSYCHRRVKRAEHDTP